MDKITSNLFDKVITENTVSNEPIIVDWLGVQIKIKPRLTVEEMVSFVNICVGSNFVSDDPDYTPEFAEYGWRYALISIYTNIDLPSDISKRYDLLTRSQSLIDIINHNIDLAQLDAIEEAVNKKISYYLKTRVQEVTGKISKLYSSLEEMGTQLVNMFSGISEEDIKAVTNALTNGAVDEGKLMKAYLDNKNIEKESVR